jgi:hypothetical protein
VSLRERGLMATRAEQLEEIAWECRTLAYAARHEVLREQLLETAEKFERLALHHHLRETRTLARLRPEC